MNKLQQIITRTLGLDAVKASYPLSSIRGWLSGNFISGTVTQYADTPAGWLEAVHSNVKARRCIEARGAAIVQAPMKLYQYTYDAQGVETRTEIESHPVIELLEHPNPIKDTAMSLRKDIASQLGIYGDCIIKKVRPSPGRPPQEIYLLPRQMVEIVPDDRYFIAGYRWMPSGELILPEDIIRLWYHSDEGSIYANSPTSTALSYINSYNIADISARAIDKRGGQGGGVISLDAVSNGIDLERMRNEWEKKYSDPANSGMDKFMPAGTTYASGAMSAQQMQREERMMRLAKDIMGSYNVPPAIAGDYSDASVLANADNQTKNFWQGWVLGELAFIEETFNNDLLWREYPGTYEAGYYFEHDVSEIAALNEDADSRMNRAVIGVQGGIISINEGREMIEMEAVDDPQADAVTSVKVTERITPATPPAPIETAPAIPPQEQPTAQTSAAIPQAPVKAVPLEPRSGVMIGFFLSTHDARQIAPADSELPKGFSREETLHLTLAFLGKTKDLEPQKQIITDTVDTFAAKHAPMSGVTQGIGKFIGVEGGTLDCLYASYDAANLAQFRTELVAALNRAGVEVATDHGFVPHIALAYVPQSDVLPKMTMPATHITFTGLTLAWGNEHHVSPLKGTDNGNVKAIPFMDFVGAVAILTDGTTGFIESIKRFGEIDGMKADKANPIVIVNGIGHAANTIQVVI